jgi:transposase
MAEIDDLFQAALGLAEPWQVVRTEFDAPARRLDLRLDFLKGARFPCPEGDQPACPVHDTEPKTWRHLNFFQHQAYLHARVPRVTCPTHGTRQVALPWARPGSGFTLLFEALLVALLAQMPVKAVADLVSEHDTRLWRLLHHHVEQARAKVSMAKVSRVGVDETSARRGQDYVSLFVDLDAPKPRVLFATEGRDHLTVERFAADLQAHGGDPLRVRDVSADMSQAFGQGVRASLPKAYLTYDRYHLVSHATKAVDEVRRAEAKQRPELKGTRYAWLKRPENLTERQAAALAELTPASVGLSVAAGVRRVLRPAGRAGRGLPRALVCGRDPQPPGAGQGIRPHDRRALGGGAALALDQDQQRGPGSHQLAGAGQQAARSRVPQQAEPDRDDLPDRRPT